VQDPAGFWPWLFQRVSGLMLVFFLAVHIWMVHFSGLGDVIDGRQEELVLFDIVERRLAQGLFVFVDFSLLALVLYHGLNGVRNILLEWRPAAQRQRPITVGLLLLGAATFAYGCWALVVFMI
jgi:succinate dehydrogenase/fumarate reductase cytochrome b subunit